MTSSGSKKIAIILPDTLQRVGLRSLLTDYFPQIEISLFSSFNAFLPSEKDFFDCYFTLSDIFVSHMDFFLPKRNKTVCVINRTAATDESVNSPCPHTMIDENEAKVLRQVLTVNLSQEEIVEQLRAVVEDSSWSVARTQTGKELSEREKDVLRLIVAGMINKEIADKLYISLNTVLTHRKNITSKLGIKTIPGLTFYAITHGLAI